MTDNLTEAQRIALNAIEAIEVRHAKYRAVNKQVKQLMGDFPTLLQACDSDIEAQIVRVLDAVLVPEDNDLVHGGLASYYLYESSRRITVDGKTYHVSTTSGLRAYVEAMNVRRGATLSSAGFAITAEEQRELLLAIAEHHSGAASEAYRIIEELKPVISRMVADRVRKGQ